jgi:serine/threonine-protein kinase
MEVPPKLIGRYEIQKELGRGTMGIVYEATDPALGRNIALKTIALSLAVRDEEVELFEQRFFAEARIAARLSHPGIVVVHDVGRDPQTGTLYIAMERLQGRTLADVIRDGTRLDWRESLFLVLRLAEALQHAHAQNVIHRDLKPANVVVLPTGEPKILDFGLAKAETARIRLTTHGQVFGTPLYMSPEQASGKELDARTDLFSLGAVAYNLLTGEAAFAAPTVTEILMRVVNSDPEPPSRVRPGLPPEVDRIVARALAKDVAARYPDAKTMANDIREVLGEQSPPEEALVAASAQAVARAKALSPRDVGVATHPGGDLEDELETLVSGITPLDGPLSTRTIPPIERKAPDPGNDTNRFARRAGLLSFGLVAVAGMTALAGFAAWKLWPVAASLSGSARPLPTAAPPVVRSTAGRPSSADPEATPTPAAPAAMPTPKPKGAPSATASTRSSPVPKPAAASESPVPTIGPAPAPAAARLSIDFDYPFKQGTLRVFVDGNLSLVEELLGQPDRNFVGIKRHRGSVEKSIAIRPGRHDVRVEVAWEDNVKDDTVTQIFQSGESRRLEIKLGRLRKNLSVEVK